MLNSMLNTQYPTLRAPKLNIWSDQTMNPPEAEPI